MKLYATVTVEPHEILGSVIETVLDFDFATEIKAGSKLLDEVAPGWYHDLDISRLMLSSGAQCVLGQLAMSRFREQIAEYRTEELGQEIGEGDRFDYSDACRVISLLTDDSSWNEDDDATESSPVAHGFLIHIDEAMKALPFRYDPDDARTKAWEDLTMQWSHSIKKRLDADKMGLQSAADRITQEGSRALV